jgi:hypothetical protein
MSAQKLQANLFSDSVDESSNFEEETPFPSYAQAQTRELLARLKVALRCPAGGQGLTAVLVCLCADIANLDQSVQEWRDPLLECFNVQSIEHPLQLDRRIVKKTRGLQTIKLFSVAAEEFGKKANLFRSIRLKTLLNAAQLHRPISEATVQILRRARLTIDAGTDTEKWLEIFKNLDRAEWPIASAFLQPDLDRTNQAGFGQAKNDSSLKTSAPTQEAHASTEPQTQRLPLTPFEWLKGQQLFCSAKDTAGVLTGWDCYAQPEFDEAMAWLGKRLTKHNEGEAAGPALLSIITGLPPMQLAQLVLSPTFDNEHPMHIEWTRGLIWFEVARLIEQAAEEPADSKEKYWSRWMAIPLPVPLHFWLTNLTKAHRKRATFGEVLNRNSASLKAGTKKLLASADRPTRGLHLSFLRRSYPRRILAECRDEAYASLVGFDTTLSTSANFNYLSIYPGRVWQICGRVFLVCGLGQPVKQPALPFAGSRFLLPDNAVQRLLAKALGEARDAASTLPHKCEFDTLRAHHESITAALALLLSLTTGHRLAKVYSYRVDALDLTLGGGAAIVSDKVTVEYHRRRIVPLTDFVVRWLRFYFSWTSVLAHRLERINRALAHQVAQVRPTHPEGESIPVLFHLSARQEFIPAGSNILNRILFNLQTTNALGRHWLDRVLRDAGVDGASITGLMGRGIAGQELFDIHSRERIRAWLERTREPIEKKLAEFDLPTAPEISGRAMQESSLGRPRSTSVCTPERKSSGVKLEHKKLIAPTEKDASCPVDWATLFHYQAFNALVKTTRSTSRSSGAIRLIWDLALQCGLTQPEQVQAIFEAIKQQTPFQDEFGVFVDWRSPNFGLRRTYLPLSIRTLVQKHHNDIKAWPLPEAAELGAVIEVRGIPRAVIKNPLEFLCRCSHAFITLEIPSALAGWAQGRLYSRVAKPTNMALPDFPCADAQAQQLGATTRRSERSPEILELRELREALILRTSDLQSNPGLVARNRIALTRLKKIKGQQKTIAGQSVWCLLNQVLTSGAQPGTASSYLSSIVGELLVVASRISHTDFTSEIGKRYFLQQLIEQLRTVENSEEESKNWTTSINHLGRSWGIQLNLKSGQEINAPPSQYAAMATPEIVQLAM